MSKRRVIEIHAELGRLRERRKMIARQIAALERELRSLTPRRPHIGIMAAVREQLDASLVPLSAKEIADRLPQFHVCRVQVMVHQAVRCGYATKLPADPAKHSHQTKWVFVSTAKKSAAKEAA